LVSERFNTKRSVTSWVLGGAIALVSAVIVYHFESLFGLVAMVATQYLQPVAALLFCVFAGWVWKKAPKLQELEQGNPSFGRSLFGKVWPIYTKFVCPLFIFVVIWASLT
jgi:NSS family neurotransmitter:Na+ symporter